MSGIKLVLTFIALLVVCMIACSGMSILVTEEPVDVNPIEPPVQTESPVDNSPSRGNSEVEFDLSEANPVPPEDVAEEIIYFVGGGRGSSCEGATSPTLNILSDEYEWMEKILADSCGWQDGESVTLTIIFPDETKTAEVVVAEGGGLLTCDIEPTLSLQPGAYTIRVEGASGVVEGTTHVVVPASPRMYSLPENWLVLYSFSSFEEVRLFAYESDAEFDNLRLAGWKQYQTDANGQLRIKIPANRLERMLRYYVYGQKSGLVSDSQRGFTIFESDLIITDCGGLPSRLSFYENARVAYVGNDTQLRMRPGFSGSSTASILQGTQVNILGARKCVDQSTWWFVHSDDSLDGWMAEDQDGVYLLEPLE